MTPFQSRFADYASFAAALQQTCVISDPWLEGKERFRVFPMILPENLLQRLYLAAEQIGQMYDEVAAFIWNNPELLDTFFRLTPYQKFMWFSSGARWHGIARLDMFVLDNGEIQVCEMNSDTPSGEGETVVVNQVCFENLLVPGSLYNPNHTFEEKFCAMVRHSFESAFPHRDEREQIVIALIYPTEIPEDLSMITVYKLWLAQRGFIVITGSPFNVQALPGNRVGMFGQEVQIIVRHYKTDWWGERLSVWMEGEEFPDPDPLDKQLRIIINAELSGNVVVINPFGAVVTQNKLFMALCWQYREHFSTASQQTIEQFIPITYRLSDISGIEDDKNTWVLKSDYGCEGDEVIIGQNVQQDIWDLCLAKADQKRWIAQKFFSALDEKTFTQQYVPEIDNASTGKTSAGVSYIPNFGVYLSGGKASGIFTRLAPVVTDYQSVCTPTFILKNF